MSEVSQNNKLRDQLKRLQKEVDEVKQANATLLREKREKEKELKESLLTNDELNAELKKASQIRLASTKTRLMNKIIKKYNIKKLNAEELEELYNEIDNSNLLEGKKPIKYVINPKDTIKERNITRRINKNMKPIKLLDHQKKVIEAYLLSGIKSTILFHGVGTGKTFTAVGIIKMYLQLYPTGSVYIVTPPAVAFNFINTMLAYGVNPQDKRFEFFSYSTFSTSKLTEKDNALCIIDEAHNLRTEVVISTSESTVVNDGVNYTTTGETISSGIRVMGTINKTKHINKVVLLTATPFVNKPYDIENLIAIGEGRMPHSEQVFSGIIAKSSRRSDYFIHRISKHTREFEDSDFPSFTEKYIPIIISEANGFTAEDIKSIKAVIQFRGDNPAFVYSRQNSITLHDAKLVWLQKNILKDKKYCIYTTFYDGVKEIIDVLDVMGVKAGLVSGVNTTVEKSDVIDGYNNFNNPSYKDTKYQIVIITKSGSEGIDLKNSYGMIVFDGVWNEASYEQVIARTIRYKSHEELPLKDRHVIVYKLMNIYQNEDEPLKSIGTGTFNYEKWLANYSIFKEEQSDKNKKKTLLDKKNAKRKLKGKGLYGGAIKKKSTDIDVTKISETKKGSAERKELLESQQFAKDRAKYDTQAVLNEFNISGYPSIDFYMLVLQKNKYNVVHKLIQELTLIPSTEDLLDLVEVRKLFDIVYDKSLTNESIIKNLREELRGDALSASRFLEKSINLNDANLQKWMTEKKETAQIIREKMKLRIKQEFFTPEHIVTKLIKMTGILDKPKGTNLGNILEPSAGWGAIIEGLLKVFSSTTREYYYNIDMVEYQKENRDVLYELVKILPFDLFLAKENDFLSFVSAKKYNYVIMNPPFHLSKKNNKQYTKDVYDYDFVMRAYAMLEDNGVLVAVTGRDWKKNKKATNFYNFVGAKIEDATENWSDMGTKTNLKKGAKIQNLDVTYIYIKKLTRFSHEGFHNKINNDILVDTNNLLVKTSDTIKKASDKNKEIYYPRPIDEKITEKEINTKTLKMKKSKKILKDTPEVKKDVKDNPKKKKKEVIIDDTPEVKKSAFFDNVLFLKKKKDDTPEVKKDDNMLFLDNPKKKVEIIPNTKASKIYYDLTGYPLVYTKDDIAELKNPKGGGFFDRIRRSFIKDVYSIISYKETELDNIKTGEIDMRREQKMEAINLRERDINRMYRDADKNKYVILAKERKAKKDKAEKDKDDEVKIITTKSTIPKKKKPINKIEKQYKKITGKELTYTNKEADNILSDTGWYVKNGSLKDIFIILSDAEDKKKIMKNGKMSSYFKDKKKSMKNGEFEFIDSPEKYKIYYDSLIKNINEIESLAQYNEDVLDTERKKKINIFSKM